jgi:hypothetical protein
MTQCFYKDRLVTSDVNKNNINRGAGKLGKNDVTMPEANSTGMPPDQKVNKDEELTYLYKYWCYHFGIVYAIKA